MNEEKRIGLFQWLWRLLFGDPPDNPEPPHECQEFTRWLSYSDVAKIVASNGQSLPEDKQYPLARNWQQRECTICGRVEQRQIPFPDLEDIDEDDED